MNPNIILNIFLFSDKILKTDNYLYKLLIIKYYTKDYQYIKTKNFETKYKFCRR
jgi:hypothetical protein